MKKDVILSVGMGPGQLDFISRLKQLGYSIIAFGRGKNSQEAIALCDYVAEIDTKDFYGAISWIDSLPVNVIAVGSFAGGAAVTTVQKLANYYKVCTAVPEALVVGSDKTKQQDLYEKYGLSTIKTWKAKDVTKNQIENSQETEFILKPSIGRGSEGIKVITKCELLNTMDGLNGEDIIQVVRKGNEYRCVMIVQEGNLKLLAPILRISYRDTVFLGVLSYSNTDIERLVPFVEGFIKKANLRNTIIKADIIVSEKCVDVIEMDIGVGGGSYYKTYISRVYNRNLMDEYIRLITGQEVKPFVVARPRLRMDYVFNNSYNPIRYDYEDSVSFFEERLGPAEIQINKLHPENKGGYSSNADFIFTVMYESEKSVNEFIADDLANAYLFSPGELS